MANIRTISPPRLNPQVNQAENMTYQQKTIPLNGKLILSKHEALIDGNYSKLVNIESDSMQSVSGMTRLTQDKVNDTYYRVRSCHFFRRDIFDEQHIIIQAYNEDMTESAILCNSNSIPYSGEFLNEILWKDACVTRYSDGEVFVESRPRIGQFTSLPRHGIVYCNGIDVCFWGGSESKVAAAILGQNELSLATDMIQSPYGGFDVTEQVNNAYGSYDSLVGIGEIMPIYMDFNGENGAITYTSNDGRVCTFVRDSHLTSAYKVGASGTSLYGEVQIPFTSRMNLGASEWTIDMCVYANSYTIYSGNYYFIQIAGMHAPNSYFAISYYHSPSMCCIRFRAQNNGTDIARYDYNIGNDNLNIWRRFIIVRSGSMVKVGVATDSNLTNVNFNLSRTSSFATQIDLTTSTKMPVFTNTDVFSIGDNSWGMTPTIIGNFIFYTGTIDFDQSGQIDQSYTPDSPLNTVDGNPYDIFLNTTSKTITFDIVSNGYRYITIGSLFPISGINFYLASVNKHPSAPTNGMTVKRFTGTDWERFTSANDYNDGTLGLTRNGKISWTPVVAQNTVNRDFYEVSSYLDGYYLYWYHLYLPYGGAIIQRITLNIPFQLMQNTWDGSFNNISACFLVSDKTEDYKTEDCTLNVLQADDYLESDLSTHIDLASSAVDGGFSFTPPHWPEERIVIITTELATAFYFDIPAKWCNKATSQINIYGWTDGGFKPFDVVYDGTSNGGATFAQSGVVAFVNRTGSPMKKREYKGSFPGYVYRVQAVNYQNGSYQDGKLRAPDNSLHVKINYIAYIPAMEKIRGYSFAIHAAGRLMLGCDNYNNPNELLVSAHDRPTVLNGTDSMRITFGGEDALTCGASIYAQYASNIYDIVLIFKASETWILQWDQTSDGTSWSRYCISPTIGCPAPHTLVTASIAFENNLNQVKNVAIWRSHSGIYISNGQSPLCVSTDIESIFSDGTINDARICDEHAWFDENTMKYHWCFFSADSEFDATDREFVLDTKEWKWSEIKRYDTDYLDGYQEDGEDSGNDYTVDISDNSHIYNSIQSACVVNDDAGQKYVFGFNDYGRMLRLNHGCDFDGEPITAEMKFGMMAIADSPLIFTSIAMLNLICLPNNEDKNVTITHYLDGYQEDGEDSGNDYTVDISDDSHKIANVMCDIYSKPAIFHEFKLTHAGSEVENGFRPLFFSVYFQSIRMHTR